MISLMVMVVVVVVMMMMMMMIGLKKYDHSLVLGEQEF